MPRDALAAFEKTASMPSQDTAVATVAGNRSRQQEPAREPPEAGADHRAGDREHDRAARAAQPGLFLALDARRRI